MEESFAQDHPVDPWQRQHSDPDLPTTAEWLSLPQQPYPGLLVGVKEAGEAAGGGVLLEISW